ncbi:hypothetical protein QJS04_geneDACA019981 [Acorus gramineus]|uniref:Uncharacterized protein n=1 Tax=Acorus gramineus TaxID=55184 RepID=A0AAV9B536_ACOGR|nr:hypothetical protein QJS04_geneDACA019981 [Acorus gramineus]
METLSKIRHPKPLLRLSASPKPLLLLPSFPTPLSLTPRPQTLTLKASLNNNNNPTPPRPPILRYAAATAAAAAALLVAGLQRPSLASSAPPSPPPLVDTLPAEEDEERRLEDHLASRPDDVESLRSLMELKVKLNKIPEAILAVDRLIEANPGDTELHLLKAHLQTYGDDVETARAGFEGILAKDPYCVEAYHGLVMAAATNSEDSEAVEEELSVLTRQIKAAMEGCRREKKKEELRDFRLLLAQVTVMRNDYDKALGIYKELVKEDPRDFRPYLCQGIIYTLMRKKSEAEKQFEIYRRLVPKGHPYARYFNDGMVAMKAFSERLE